MKKSLYIIAGANGSGKTTFAMEYTKSKNLQFINADEIAKTFDPDDVQKYKVKAGKEFFAQLESSLDNSCSFMIESTLSGKYLARVIQKAKSKGFFVVLIYLYLETDSENILRVKNRVLNGGHDVPEEDIVRRYKRSKKLFWHMYKELVDSWILFYNGDNTYELIADNGTIIDEEYFDLFLKDIVDE